ncbi:TonB-dependent receptor family protein [Variovorax soli]|uniref:TonB-dependent receptor family protein n=1 Tax=Variovorax soli TaxID=376815 RepID=UPI0008398FA4|nr:TonB-dependent siderophore receptor [Variovorax soli]
MLKKRSLPSRTLVATACGLALPLHAWAQSSVTASNGGQLNAIEVSADWLGSGLQNSVQGFAGARTVVKREAIAETGASTIDGVMRFIPGVQVTNNSSSGGSAISLNIGVRGLEGRYSPRTTVLLDGIPMAVAPYGQPQLSFAPLSLGNIESIDVVRGGGAVRYGPQSVGGIINFRTRDIPNQPVAGDAAVRYNDFSEGGHNTQYSAFVGGQVNQDLGVALLYSGQDGSGWRQHSDEKTDDVALKFRYALTSTSEVYGKFSYYEARTDVPGGLTSAMYAADPFQSQRTRDQWSGRRTGIDLGYINTISDTQEFELRTYYSDSFRQSVLANGFDATATSLSSQPRNYGVFGIEPRYTQRFFAGSFTHDVSVGMRYLRERADETVINTTLRTGRSSVSRASDNSTDAYAYYIDDQIAVGNWRVTPGLRFEDVETGRVNKLNGYSESVKDSQPLPSLNVAYLLNSQFTLFGNYTTSYGSIQHLQLNLNPRGNPLEAETAETVEAGVRWNRGDGTSAEATVFDMRFDNQLELFGSGATAYWVNRGKTHHQGVETRATYAFDKAGLLSGLSAYAALTYTKATLREGAFAGNDLPFYSRWTDALGLRYALGTWDFELSSTHQSNQYADDANTQAENAAGSLGVIPGFRLWNVQARWKMPSRPGVELAFGVNNLTDERYFTRTTDTNAGKLVGAPRTVFMQGTVKF